MSFDLRSNVPALLGVVQLPFSVGRDGIRFARDSMSAKRDPDLATAMVRVECWRRGECGDESLGSGLEALRAETLSDLVRANAVVLRSGAGEQLAQLFRSTSWFATLRRRARSPFWWRRAEAANLLSLLVVETELDLVRKLVVDRHQAVRLASVGLLRRLPEPGLLGYVFDRCPNAAPEMTQSLFEVLQFHDRSVATVILARLRRAAEPEVLLLALEYVGEVADPIYMDATLELVDHPTPCVRAAAARAATAFPHRRSAHAVAGNLRDASPSVRAAACEALGTIRCADFAWHLRPRLGDTSRSVRMAAGVALRRLGIVGTRILRDVARDPNGPADAGMAQYVLALDTNRELQHGF